MNKIPGTWHSPISAKQITEQFTSIKEVVVDRNQVYWNKFNPSASSRHVISCDGVDILPSPYSARSLVHEYGGTSFTVTNGVVYFVNETDQNLYKLADKKVTQITTQSIRLAELTITPFGILAVAEQHHGTVDNFLTLIDITNGTINKLHAEHDFYAYPCINQQTNRIAWLTWDHPNMPWYYNQLWVADFIDGKIVNPLAVTIPEQAFSQPRWLSDTLYFACDRSGWWNMYYLSAGNEPQPVCPLAAEFAEPLWNLGTSTWDFYQNNLLCRYIEDGKHELAIIDLQQKSICQLSVPFTNLQHITVTGDHAVILASSSNQHPALIKLDIESCEFTILQKSSEQGPDLNYISIPKHLAFNSKKHQAYAYFYEPYNKDHQLQQDELPPLLVISHGGPTAATTDSLSLFIQFWTSRGFAVVDVNYGGSSNYGRKFRHSLDYNWGIVDVEDCVAAVEHLITQKLVNPQQVFIRGKSAGGYTTLAALAFTNIFAGGAIYYGVCDLLALTKDTHKFEKHYLDSLIGPYPKEHVKYLERSPINHVAKFNAPLVVFQGAKDQIVLPNQAEAIVNALKKKNITVDYTLYPDEQHGFRNPANIIDSLEQEYAFFKKILLKPQNDS